MPEKYTIKDAEDCAARLAKALGKKFDPAKQCYENGGYNSGCWYLDTNNTYGGSKIAERMEGSGARSPLGDTRMNPKEFCNAVDFSLKVADIFHQKRR